MENDILICNCHSADHQVVVSYDTEENIVFLHIHLTTHRNFFQRLWIGFKYAFGFKCRYGAWDEFILNPKDAPKIEKILNTLYNGNQS